MIEKDDFLEQLRRDARPLRYEGDDVTWTRLQARVRAGIASAPGIEVFLTRWFRPVAASLAVLTLVAALGSAWYVENRDPVSLDSIAQNSSVEVSVDGEAYSVPN
jgi:hypothetical protein